MKYLWALLAIIGELMVWSMISTLLGWRSMGGGIVLIIMVAIFIATWRAITKKEETSDTEDSEVEEKKE